MVVCQYSGCSRLQFASHLPLPPLLRLPTVPVALVETALARLLAFGRVGHSVVVVSLYLLGPHFLIGFRSLCLQRFPRRLSRNQTIATRSDQILASGLN